MKNTALRLLSIFGLSLAFSSSAMAQVPKQQQGWMWGFGVNTAQDVYTNFDNRVVPIPVIGYVGERLRVYGPFVSYQLLQERQFSVEAQLVPVFAGFKQDDSPVFEGMEDRDFTFAAGLSANYRTGSWTFSVSGNVDVLGKFDGYQMAARVGKIFRHQGFMIEPSLRLNFQDSNYVNYYYGVRSEEATATRTAYEGSSAVNTEIGLAISTLQFFGGMTRVEVGATFFDNAISNSPITDDDMAMNAMLIYTRFF